MTTPINDQELQAELKKRFVSLPKSVQDSITSADIEKRLRELASTHKLHLDQWQLLENNVMMTLLGLQAPSDLAQHLRSDLGINADLSFTLATEISRVVFEPIREDLERTLEHPDAKAEDLSTEEAARRQILSSSDERTAPAMPSTPMQAPIVPATPPSPPPAQKAVRAMPASGAYKPGEPSAARKDVHDDPYRETPA